MIPNWQGYAWIASAALLWGLSGAFGKLLLNRPGPPIDPLVLSQTRATAAFLVLLLIAVVARRDVLRVSARQLGGLVVLGVGGLAGCNYTYFKAIQLSNVATAILAQYTAPVWLMLFTVLVMGERFSAAKAAAAVLSFGGCALAVGGYRPELLRLNAAGLLWGLGSALTFCFYNLWGSRMNTRDTRVGANLLYTLGAVSVFWALVSPPQRLLAAGFSTRDWLALAAFGIVSVLIPNGLYYAGLRLLRPSHAVITASLEPVFAILFAAWLAGEPLRAVYLAGAGGVIAAVVLLQRSGDS